MAIEYLKRNLIRSGSIAMLAVTAAQAAGPAPLEELGAAEDSSLQTWWRGEYATGTWGGLREHLSRWGLAANVEYTADGLGTVSGGIRTGGAYLGLVQVGMDWDPEPLIGGWEGALIRASGIYAHQTRSITYDLVGDINGVSNIEAPEGFRLYEVWIQQQLWQERVTVQLGNLLADEYFAYTDLGGLFVNSGFGWSQFVAANTATVVPAFPFAAPGVRLEWRPTRATYFQVGFYDGDALDNELGELENNPDGLRFRLHGDQGLFTMAEVGYKLNQQEEDTGLPGTYKIGGYYHSGDHTDLYRDVHGDSFVLTGLPPRTHDGSYMLYLAAEQTVWRESNPGGTCQGLGAFFRIGMGPANRNPYHLVVDGGLHYQGLIPGRDQDALGLGLIYLGVSPDLRKQEKDDRDVNHAFVPAVSDYEMVLELTYRAELNPWWFLQPDLQWIFHPGASAATEDALVVGLRTGFAF